jgi:excisionase family DNA binding protein
MTITVEEAARRIGVSAQRVRQFIAAKKISAVRPGLRRLMVDADSVAAFQLQPTGRPKGGKNKSTETIALRHE